MAAPSSPHYESRTPESKDNWGTPWPIVHYLGSLLSDIADDNDMPFDVDVAAEQHNAKASVWFGPGSVTAEDALKVAWTGAVHVFCNPPYNDLRSWIEKVCMEVEENEGTLDVTLLLPARTDTVAFHTAMAYCKDLVLFKGRISFLNPDGSPQTGTMFPSVAMRLAYPQWYKDQRIHLPVVKEIMKEYA